MNIPIESIPTFILIMITFYVDRISKCAYKNQNA